MTWTDPKRAQGPLALVQGFVNTADRLRGGDGIATPDRAAATLVDLGLLDDGTEVDEGGRRRLVVCREALRGVLAARTDAEVDGAAAARRLDGVLDGVPVRVRLSEAGRPTVRPDPRAAPADRAIGGVAAAIATADADGDWPRLKACRNPACRWAFYDASRNRSGQWCDMDVCGARHKMRAYRQRHR